MSDQPVDETADEAFAPPENWEPDRKRVDSDEDVADEPEVKPEEQITELTEEERAQFRSLLAIGKRVKTVYLFDQKIEIATLMSDDEIRVGDRVKKHVDSPAYNRAYQVAYVASAIRSVNGESWMNTLEQNPDPDVLFESKLRKAERLYPLVVQYIYRECISMDTEFAELAAKLGKL